MQSHLSHFRLINMQPTKSRDPYQFTITTASQSKSHSMTISLDELKEKPIKELMQFQDDVASAIAFRKEADKQTLLTKFAEMADEFGFTVDELVADKGKKNKPKKEPGKAKYQNPADPKQTWNGNGRRPKWIIELLAAGKLLEDIAI